MEYNYLVGYKDALEDLDKFITAKIRENGGAREMMQVLNVWNQTIGQLHAKKQTTYARITEILEQETEDCCESTCGDTESAKSIQADDVANMVASLLDSIVPFMPTPTPLHVVRKGHTSREEF